MVNKNNELIESDSRGLRSMPGLGGSPESVHNSFLEECRLAMLECFRQLAEMPGRELRGARRACLDRIRTISVASALSARNEQSSLPAQAWNSLLSRTALFLARCGLILETLVRSGGLAPEEAAPMQDVLLRWVDTLSNNPAVELAEVEQAA